MPGKGPFLQLSVAPLKLKRAVKTHEQGRGGCSRSRGPGCPHLGPLVLQKAGMREERGLACSGSLGSCLRAGARGFCGRVEFRGSRREQELPPEGSRALLVEVSALNFRLLKAAGRKGPLEKTRETPTFKTGCPPGLCWT